MDIYRMLKENTDSIMKEDLEFFEIELATGEYDSDYISKCLELINEIKQFKKNKISINKLSNSCDDIFEEDSIDLEILNKQFDTNKNFEKKEEKIKNLIIESRSSNQYKKDFNDIINDYDIDENFIDKNYIFFKQIEIDELTKKINFSEKFLEKYFKLLNHKLIAEYQIFSENFYMKYFNQLDEKIVLKKGKNSWINKDQRSSKLTVFLKLKGINL